MLSKCLYIIYLLLIFPVCRYTLAVVEPSVFVFFPGLKADSTTLPKPTLKKTDNYARHRQLIQQKQIQLSQRYRQASNADKNKIIDEAASCLNDALIVQFFPFWYGTEWSFDGYTATPQKGMVGCSYFVSTTLLHAGFNLDRYRLAQQGPQTEANALMIEGSPINIQTDGTFADFKNLVAKQCEEGLYFIGLSHSHVGYLYYREDELYFIHSSYGNSGQVEINYAGSSDVLSTFENFYLTPISNNRALLVKWLSGEKIEVLKGSD